MSNDTPKPPQLPLLPEATPFELLDSRVRITIINDDEFASIFDILEYHGNKKNPRQAWKNILKYMQDKQGFSNSPDFGQYAFEGKDGKRKAVTPVVNIEGFMRLAQSADVPEWEEIRNWQARVTGQEARSKAGRDRDNQLSKLQKAGYGDRPEVIRFERYNEELDEYAKLKKMYSEVIDAPDYASLNNAEYEAFFGMFAKQLKKVYGDVSIRSIMGTVQLETMIYAERRLREALSTQQVMTNERAIQIIKVVIEPLGVYLRGYTQLMNIDLVTGKPLLGKGDKQ